MQHTSGGLLSPQKDMLQPLQDVTAAAASPIITVEHLVKRYKREETSAVDDISFTVAPGSLFALLGPNGAGKTTTISILTTTLLPTSGRVTIAGHDVIREPSAV